MRKNSGLALCALVGLAVLGCSHSREAVFVDYDKLAPAEPNPVQIYVPPNAQAAAASGHSQPELAARTLEGNQAERMDAAKQLLSDDRQHTVREIENRLRRLYQLAADRMTMAKYGDLDPIRAAALRDAEIKIHAAFVAYSLQKGPKLARLALIVGFPDPDPNSARPPDAARKRADERFAEAKQLRDDIAKLDADFAKVSDGYAKEAQDKIDVDLTQMREDIQQRKEEADARAAAEAARLATVSQKSLGLSDQSMRDVELPQVAPSSAGAAPTLPAPPIATTTIEQAAVDRGARIRALESQARIWAGLRGYDLVDMGKGRDATEEFQAWAKTLTAGR